MEPYDPRKPPGLTGHPSSGPETQKAGKASKNEAVKKPADSLRQPKIMPAVKIRRDDIHSKHLHQRTALNEHALKSALGQNNNVALELVLENYPNARGRKQRNALHMACRLKLTDKLAELVRLGVDINAIDSEGNTPLHLAIISGCSDEACQVLITEKAALGTTNEHKKTPENLASEANRPELAQLLQSIKRSKSQQESSVKKPAPAMPSQPLENPEGRSLLHNAVLNASSEQCWQLLQQGISPNAGDVNGLTPMHLGLEKRSVNTYKILLDHHGDPTLCDKAGWSVARTAAYYGRFDLLSLFKKERVDCLSLDPSIEDTLYKALGNNQCSFVNEYGPDIMMDLARKAMQQHNSGRLSLLCVYLDKPAKESLFLWAIQNQFWPEAEELLGALIPLTDYFVDQNGNTPIHLLIQLQNADLAARLLKQCPEWIDIPNHQKQTALHLACSSESGSQNAITLLLNFKPDVNALDENGCTPMHYGLKGRSQNSYRILLEAKANPALVNNQGQSVMQCAAEVGRLDLLTEFNRFNWKWNKDTAAWESAWRAISNDKILAADQSAFLLFAQGVKEFAQFQTLMDRGLRIFEADDEGQTALFYLLAGDHLDMAEKLIEQVANDSKLKSPAEARANAIKRLLPVNREQCLSLIRATARANNREALRLVLNDIMPANMQKRSDNTPYGNLTLMLLNDDKNRLKASAGYMVQNPWADVIMVDLVNGAEGEEGEIQLDSLCAASNRHNLQNCKFVVDGHGPNLFGLHGADFAHILDNLLSAKHIQPDNQVRLTIYGCESGKPLLEADSKDFIMQLMTALARKHNRYPIVTAASETVYVMGDGETLTCRCTAETRHLDSTEQVVEFWQGSKKFLNPDYEYASHFKGLTTDNLRNDLVKEYEFRPGTGICEHDKHRGPGDESGGLHSLQIPGDEL